MMKHLPEPNLVKRLTESDENAFRIVFDEFHHRIFLFAFGFLKDKALSEEIVQDTFMNFWLHRHNLETHKPVAPYLFTIARRTLIDAWRKSARSENFRQNIYAKMTVMNNETEETVFLNDLERIISRGLNQLNKHQQEVFALSRHEGLSYEEIAEHLQISKNTVKYHLVNALKIMRTHLGENDIMYGLLFSIVFINLIR